MSDYLEEKDLTNGECLVICRRRLNLNQVEMAKLLKVTRYIYQKWENDWCEFNLPKKWKLAAGRLTPAERCFLYRRRCHMLQSQVALELGVSRQWIILMETGRTPCDELLWYWEQ